MRRINIYALIIAVAALIAAGWAIYEPYTVRQDAAAAQSQAKSLADQVAEACAKGGPTAAQLGSACAKAAEVQGQPNVAQAAAPLDPDALRAAARTAVVEYCSTRNQCRGVDGSTPNFDAIVDVVLARIPTPKDGTPGRDAPTPDWAAQVAAYCGQANEPCRGTAGHDGTNGTNGTDGKDGAQGVSVTDVAPIRDDNGQCQWVVTLHDPATGKDSTVTHPASDAACSPSSSTPNLIPAR